MINLSQLNEIGWTLVGGVSSSADMLKVGKLLGNPIPSPNGEIVKKIEITEKTKALPGSQSELYGRGPFPLHTDTVFWPVPVQYVILRCYGDTRRPTTIENINVLLSKCGPEVNKLVETSVWTVGIKSKCFYCSLKFRHNGCVGWRYDSDLMNPANDAAIQVNKALSALVAEKQKNIIEWNDDKALVISNWNVLHGRGSEPENEGERTIERLYVR